MRTFGISRNIVGITNWGRWIAGSSPVSDSVSKLTGSAGTGLSMTGGGAGSGLATEEAQAELE